jgi:signal transduction histidine kinase
MSEIELGIYKPKFDELDLYGDILSNLFSEYESLTKNKNISFRIINNIKNPIIKADLYSIQQIFDNLINNAIKFTEKGEVKIIIDNDENNRLFVEIIDTGIGMDQAYINQLFVPFSQESKGYTRRYDGTGLGLAVVRKFCDFNNAHIAIHTQKNKGSRFKITFT